MEHGSRDDAPTTTAASPAPASRLEWHLLAWQESGDHVHLESLLATVLPLAEHVARSALHRRGVHDPAAVDETISLLLDHLRRLPGASAGERTVTPFAPGRDDRCTCSTSDPGWAYVIWLTRERAADVARSHRRHGRHAAVFSVLDEQATRLLNECRASDEAVCEAMGTQAGVVSNLHRAIPRLPARERLLVELLLEGKSQAAISHVLDVCEGTVSRLRGRAIAMLRDLLTE